MIYQDLSGFIMIYHIAFQGRHTWWCCTHWCPQWLHPMFFKARLPIESVSTHVPMAAGQRHGQHANTIWRYGFAMVCSKDPKVSLILWQFSWGKTIGTGSEKPGILGLPSPFAAPFVWSQDTQQFLDRRGLAWGWRCLYI